MTYLPAVGVLDRTGRLMPVVQAALDELGPSELLDMGLVDDLPSATPDVDVLVVGPRELTAAALRRVAQWRGGTDGAALVACPRGEAPAALATVAVDAVVAGDPPAAARLRDVLEAVLADLGAAPTTGVLEDLGLDDDSDGDLEQVLAVTDLWDDEPAEAWPDGAQGDQARDAGAAEGASEPADDELGWDDLDVPVPQPQPRAAAPLAPPPPRELGAVATAARAGRAAVPAARAPERVAGELDGDVGMVLSVVSPTGGCGKTFLATNAAAHLAAAGRRVLLVDLDLQFGEVGAALQVRHPYSLYDGLYDGDGRALPDEALGDHLDELVAPHELGFDVLTAPRDPALSEDVTGGDVRHLLSVTASRYDVVVVDTPPALNDVVLAAVDLADVVCVLATLDVPSLRNLTSLLDVLRDAGLEEERVRLVLNKVEPDIGIDVAQAQDAFGGRFVGELPAARAASRSINTGTVVLRSEPRSPLARAIVRTLEALLPEDVLPRGVAVADGGAPPPPSALRSLFRPRRPSPAPARRKSS